MNIELKFAFLGLLVILGVLAVRRAFRPPQPKPEGSENEAGITSQYGGYSSSTDNPND